MLYSINVLADLLITGQIMVVFYSITELRSYDKAFAVKILKLYNQKSSFILSSFL